MSEKESEKTNLNDDDNATGFNQVDGSLDKSLSTVVNTAGGLSSENQVKVNEMLADIGAVLSGPQSDREIFEFNDICKRLALLSGRGQPPVMAKSIQAGPVFPDNDDGKKDDKKKGSADKITINRNILDDKTGTKPKIRQLPEKKTIDLTTEDETKTSSRSQSSKSSKSGSRRRVRRRRSQVRRKILPKIESASSDSDVVATTSQRGKGKKDAEITKENMVECLTKAMGATKKKPEPKAFDIQSKRKWDVFLDQFEKYCASQYSDDREDWSEVLEKYLEGEVREMYLCLQGCSALTNHQPSFPGLC